MDSRPDFAAQYMQFSEAAGKLGGLKEDLNPLLKQLERTGRDLGAKGTGIEQLVTGTHNVLSGASNVWKPMVDAHGSILMMHRDSDLLPAAHYLVMGSLEDAIQKTGGTIAAGIYDVKQSHSESALDILFGKMLKAIARASEPTAELSQSMSFDSVVSTPKHMEFVEAAGGLEVLRQNLHPTLRQLARAGRDLGAQGMDIEQLVKGTHNLLSGTGNIWHPMALAHGLLIGAHKDSDMLPAVHKTAMGCVEDAMRATSSSLETAAANAADQHSQSSLNMLFREMLTTIQKASAQRAR